MSIPALRMIARVPELSLRHRREVQPRLFATLALFGANVIWAGSAVASKATLDHMHPLTMTSARTAIAVVLLIALLCRRGLPIATGRTPALLGLAGVGLFGACQNIGLLFADATTTALLGAATPILTMTLAIPLLGERLNRLQVVGVTVALTGVTMIVLIGGGDLGRTTAIANVLPLASAICFAVYNIIGRRAFRDGNTLSLVAGSARYGLIFLLPLTLLEMMQTEITAVAFEDAALLLYLGAGCSVAAFLLSGYGLSHMNAGHSGMYGNLKPVIGVLLAVTLLGEPLRAVQVAGGVLVLLGIGIASWQWLREAPPMGEPGLDAQHVASTTSFSRVVPRRQKYLPVHPRS
jgi:drug/metabolite transporter (DMT)-like permease